MAAKLTAHFEHREYFFTVLSKTDKMISIDMYGILFTFHKGQKGWEKSPENRNMNPGLMEAVFAAIQGESSQ